MPTFSRYRVEMTIFTVIEGFVLAGGPGQRRGPSGLIKISSETELHPVSHTT